MFWSRDSNNIIRYRILHFFFFPAWASFLNSTQGPYSSRMISLLVLVILAEKTSGQQGWGMDSLKILNELWLNQVVFMFISLNKSMCPEGWSFDAGAGPIYEPTFEHMAMEVQCFGSLNDSSQTTWSEIEYRVDSQRRREKSIEVKRTNDHYGKLSQKCRSGPDKASCSMGQKQGI